jgi:hypothetical protein
MLIEKENNMEKSVVVGNIFIDMRSGLACIVKEIKLVAVNSFFIVLRYKDNSEYTFEGNSLNIFFADFVKVKTEF